LTAQLRPLEPGDESWLADLHNRAFSDYALPARLDASALATYMAETGVRHDLSFAAFVDGHPASFCLGALREDRASVRGEGTEQQAYGQGCRICATPLGVKTCRKTSPVHKSFASGLE